MYSSISRRSVQWLIVFVALSASSSRLAAMIDLDGNRLNDLWEIYFDARGLDPSADDDGDGETNLQECLRWTNPRDPNSNSKTPLSSASVNDLLTDSDGDGLSDYEEVLLGLDPKRAASKSDWVGGDLAYAVSLVGSSNSFRLGEKTVSGTQPTPRQSARFLMQATLGGTMEDITKVSSLGVNGWLDAQFQITPSVTHDEVYKVIASGKGYDIHRAWWRQVLTADDLLRQRMAVSLTEIYVISERSINFVAWEVMQYYDNLGKLSFGNWRNILRTVTLDPLMGHYLSHLKSRKADLTLQRFPDENYAREIMQLFSIGLWKLNPDGSHKLDEKGRDIPTYDNTDISNFARVFTGFGFSGNQSDTSKPEQFFTALLNYAEPMQIWPSEHDMEEKRLLRGMVLPAFAAAPGRKPMDDVDDAIDNLFHDPNVGPFVGRLLIQRLVTSNPSRDYVRRVALAFEDNGRGERGDMKAVIKAIFLDSEARNPALDETRSGRLREPYLRYVRLARTFKARSAEGSFKIGDNSTLESIDQILLNAPSVFNFFLPDYQPPGPLAAAHLYAPEFQIMTSSTAITTLNLYSGMVATGFGDAGNEAEVMRLNFEEEIKLADQPEALIDLLDLKMACGSLSGNTRKILLTAYGEMPSTYSAEDKVKAVVELITLSPDFAIFQ